MSNISLMVEDGYTWDHEEENSRARAIEAEEKANSARYCCR